jgi:hypothetical protein
VSYERPEPWNPCGKTHAETVARVAEALARRQSVQSPPQKAVRVTRSAPTRATIKAKIVRANSAAYRQQMTKIVEWVRRYVRKTINSTQSYTFADVRAELPAELVQDVTEARISYALGVGLRDELVARGWTKTKTEWHKPSK